MIQPAIVHVTALLTADSVHGTQFVCGHLGQAPPVPSALSCTFRLCISIEVCIEVKFCFRIPDDCSWMTPPQTPMHCKVRRWKGVPVAVDHAHTPCTAPPASSTLVGSVVRQTSNVTSTRVGIRQQETRGRGR
ncbi:hypothetical protein B0H10DRAFT_1977588, partial [Mycena sp. CBHHK59/15]